MTANDSTPSKGERRSEEQSIKQAIRREWIRGHCGTVGDELTGLDYAIRDRCLSDSEIREQVVEQIGHLEMVLDILGGLDDE